MFYQALTLHIFFFLISETYSKVIISEHTYDYNDKIVLNIHLKSYINWVLLLTTANDTPIVQFDVNETSIVPIGYSLNGKTMTYERQKNFTSPTNWYELKTRSILSVQFASNFGGFMVFNPTYAGEVKIAQNKNNVKKVKILVDAGKEKEVFVKFLMTCLLNN